MPSDRLGVAAEAFDGRGNYTLGLREQLVSKSLQVDGTMITVTASLGVAASPEHGSEPIDLIRSADEALYLAKHSGKNQVRTASARGQEIAT